MMDCAGRRIVESNRERDAAIRERDEALRERDVAIQERDEAIASKQRAHAALRDREDEALRAAAECDEARAVARALFQSVLSGLGPKMLADKHQWLRRERDDAR